MLIPASPPLTSDASSASQILVTLAQQLSLADDATVLAGQVSGSGPGSAISVLRASSTPGRLSSVDDADLTIGQIVVAQALYQQLAGGRTGSYGIGSGATGTGPSAPSPSAACAGHVGRVRQAARRQCRERIREQPVTRRVPRAAATLRTAGLAAAAARVAYAAGYPLASGGTATWARANHRGEPVTLLEGPAVATGAALAAAVAPGLPPRARAGLVLATVGAGGFGGYDDLAGSSSRRGFRGHLGALAHGEVTTGAVKLGGIGATGLAASALLGGGPADVAVNAALIAGSANLLNLFDLRPGRAIKVAVAGGALLIAGRPRVPWPATRLPPRWARRWRWPERISVSGPCSVTPAPTRSVPCSAPPRPCACPGPPGSHCWPGSPG